ncbi:MAG: type II toxin-antitoxin system VapB family antitoxin [Verrucomicrobia bacterium]|nr:type II toxin-antitoxin system VapB family antitoxin [Verrucomicrobiota bacterium]
MRISVDIDESILAEVMALTGESQKSPALSKAIVEFVYRRRAQEFGRLIREGAFDYPSPSLVAEEDPANPVPPLTED